MTHSCPPRRSSDLNDAQSIRGGGSHAALRGTELYNFGAFFSRAYRENDYLWGRLHGAERMVDLICSTLDRSEEHTSELQPLMRISYAVLCLKKKNKQLNLVSNHNKHTKTIK